MTLYMPDVCSACDGLDVAVVSECDACDQPFCAECRPAGLCLKCAETLEALEVVIDEVAKVIPRRYLFGH